MASKLGAAFAVAALALAACGEPPPKKPAKYACPPPPEPTHQSVVVGTIGKLHLVESRYPLSKLGDVIVALKPDLVLLGVRVDAYREGHLEDGSFEMTYVQHVAKQRGIEIEPIDWFREQDLGVTPPAVEPWDEAEIAKREAAVLGEPRLFTFEQANGNELEAKIFLAFGAEQRHRNGNGVVTRRQANLQSLVASAIARHDKPKKVVAFVDVFDRPTVDLAIRALGYDARTPAEAMAKSKDGIIPDIPPEVVAEWKAQLDRAHAKTTGAEGPAKGFWAEREQVLKVAVERKAACCVTQAALQPK